MTTPSGAVRQILYGRDPHLVPTDGDTYLLKVCASREAARSVRAASARSVSGGSTHNLLTDGLRFPG